MDSEEIEAIARRVADLVVERLTSDQPAGFIRRGPAGLPVDERIVSLLTRRRATSRLTAMRLRDVVDTIRSRSCTYGEARNAVEALHESGVIAAEKVAGGYRVWLV